jgi:hypothetical protein
MALPSPVAFVGACSSERSTSCADLSARIAEMDTPPTSADQSWESVEPMAERSIEPDSLRAQMAQKNCERAPNCSAFTFIAAVTLSSGVTEVTATIACGSTG